MLLALSTWPTKSGRSWKPPDTPISGHVIALKDPPPLLKLLTETPPLRSAPACPAPDLLILSGDARASWGQRPVCREAPGWHRRWQACPSVINVSEHSQINACKQPRARGKNTRERPAGRSERGWKCCTSPFFFLHWRQTFALRVDRKYIHEGFLSVEFIFLEGLDQLMI